MKSKGFLGHISAFATALFVLPFFRMWRRRQKVEADKYLDEELARQRAEADQPRGYL